MATGAYLIGERAMLIAAARAALERWYTSSEADASEVVMYLENALRQLEEANDQLRRVTKESMEV